MKFKLESLVDEEWRHIAYYPLEMVALYALAYYYECWYPPADFRVLNEAGEVVNKGRMHKVCWSCKQKKFMCVELNDCSTCLNAQGLHH